MYEYNKPIIDKGDEDRFFLLHMRFMSQREKAIVYNKFECSSNCNAALVFL